MSNYTYQSVTHKHRYHMSLIQRDQGNFSEYHKYLKSALKCYYFYMYVDIASVV
jgi:hypothetical protein